MSKIIFFSGLILAYTTALGADPLSLNCERSQNDPSSLKCVVQNMSADCSIVILKAALAEDGAKTTYPHAQYHLVALFPEAEDGRRVVECAGKLFSGYTLTDQNAAITLKPGESYTFVRKIVSRNDDLLARLESERFFLFWHISLRYASNPPERTYVSSYHGFIDSAAVASSGK